MPQVMIELKRYTNRGATRPPVCIVSVCLKRCQFWKPLKIPPPHN